MSVVRITMADTMRRAFERSGMSVRALSLQAKIPYASAHGFTRSRRNISLETLTKICEVLGLELRPVRR